MENIEKKNDAITYVTKSDRSNSSFRSNGNKRTLVTYALSSLAANALLSVTTRWTYRTRLSFFARHT